MKRASAPTLLHMGEPHCGERANRMFALDFGAKQGQHSDKARMSRARDAQERPTSLCGDVQGRTKIAGDRKSGAIRRDGERGQTQPHCR